MEYEGNIILNISFERFLIDPTLVFFPVMVSHNIYRKQVHKINKLFLLITLNRHITLEGKKYLKHKYCEKEKCA